MATLNFLKWFSNKCPWKRNTTRTWFQAHICTYYLQCIRTASHAHTRVNFFWRLPFLFAFSFGRFSRFTASFVSVLTDSMHTLWAIFALRHTMDDVLGDGEAHPHCNQGSCQGPVHQADWWKVIEPGGCHSAFVFGLPDFCGETAGRLRQCLTCLPLAHFTSCHAELDLTFACSVHCKDCQTRNFGIVHPFFCFCAWCFKSSDFRFWLLYCLSKCVCDCQRLSTCVFIFLLDNVKIVPIINARSSYLKCIFVPTSPHFARSWLKWKDVWTIFGIN